MSMSDSVPALPDAQSPNLHLDHPTAAECHLIWKLTFHTWRDALTQSSYLEESAYLTSVPLAKDGGMTLWLLIDKDLTPGQRPILCSCETFRKHTLLSDSEGNVIKVILHGVASVFCDPAYRGRGYARRMMRELGEVLKTWQTETVKCVGSVLYSDIGKTYYAELGWHALPHNTTIGFHSMVASEPLVARKVLDGDLDYLCDEDEAMIRKAMADRSKAKRSMMILPDQEHMRWHHRKAEFACEKLFGKQPKIKGAIAGQPGNRIWVIWTHRYYGDPESDSSSNTLYILRLVIENQLALDTSSLDKGDLPNDAGQYEMQVQNLKAVLRNAQSEAAEWMLPSVKIWNPTPLVLRLIELTQIEHWKEERKHEGITSLLWYGDGSDSENAPEFSGNEKYAWC